MVLLFPNLPWALLLPKLQLSCSWTEPQLWPVTLKTAPCLSGSPTWQVHMKSCHNSIWLGQGEGGRKKVWGRTESIPKSSVHSGTSPPAFPTTDPTQRLLDWTARPAAGPSLNCTLPRGRNKSKQSPDPACYSIRPTFPVGSHLTLLHLQLNHSPYCKDQVNIWNRPKLETVPRLWSNSVWVNKYMNPPQREKWIFLAPGVSFIKVPGPIFMEVLILELTSKN